MATFPQRFKYLYQNNPTRVAITFQQAGKDDLQITYEDLYNRSSGYTEALLKEKIKPGEVVVLIFDYSPDLLYAFWGAILHGAIPAILPFLTEKLSPERYHSDLASLIEITKPSAIITYPDFEDLANEVSSEGNSVRSVLISNQIDLSSRPSKSNPKGINRSPSDIVLLQHSSGTTGLQKGVALSHQAVFNQIDALAEAINLDPETDRIVSWLPLYHDMGLIAGFILPVLFGVPLVLMSPFDWVKAPYRLMESVSKYQGTLTWLPNFAYNFCAHKIRDRYLENIDLSSWRMIINCSEPVRWESHQAFVDKFKEYSLKDNVLHTSYAMAENTFGVTQSRLSQPPRVDKIDRDLYLEERIALPPQEGKTALNMLSSGKALNNTQIKIVDPSGQTVKDRIIGEIAIRSNCMLTEYFNRPDITEKSFQDEWFLTGDFGYLSAGEIFVTGRKKEMIIVGGKNIYPRDIEELVYEIPGVHPGRAVVFGIFNEKTGTEDVVIVAESDQTNQNEINDFADSIRKFITKNSPIALRFVQIVKPKWIIKTSSGKIARHANKEKYLIEFFQEK